MNNILWHDQGDVTAWAKASSRWVAYFIPSEDNRPSANLLRTYQRGEFTVDLMITVSVPVMPIHGEWNPLDDDTFIHVIFVSNTPSYMTIREINDMWAAINEAKRKIHHEVHNNLMAFVGKCLEPKS